MNKSQFIFVLIATLLTVIFLSTVWEFWLESFIGGVFHNDHEPENLNVKLEYVISITIFVILSLIFPAAVGYRLLENDEKMKEEIKRLSEEDYLTKLYNRRIIHEIIEKEIIRSSRYDSAFSIILLDIDDFKSINDTYGHNTGDKVLIQFSKTLTQTIREADIAGRWGGEEFLVICPETNIDGATALAEKLRVNIENCRFANAGNVTASFGVAGMRHADNVKSLIQRADNSLYSAKEAGKNCVVAS
jgi:polar amino acid transport system substrate-binding protein